MTSVYGDVSYTAGLMVWQNLRQYSLSTAYSKVNFNDSYQIRNITAISLGYSNNYGNSTIMTSFSKMKPFKSGLTVGVGVSMGTTFVSNPITENFMMSYNILATKSFKLGNRITYSPAVIWTQTPLSTSQGGFDMDWEFIGPIKLKNDLYNTRIHGMAILANSFAVKVTRRFAFNIGWTIIKSTNSDMPFMNSFMIGSKLPF